MGVPKSPTQVFLWAVTQLTLQTHKYHMDSTLSKHLQTMGLYKPTGVHLQTNNANKQTGQVGQQVQAEQQGREDRTCKQTWQTAQSRTARLLTLVYYIFKSEL